MSPANRLKFLVLAGVAAITASPSQAATIVLNDIGGVSGTQAAIGYRVAADYWESVLTNDAVINLNVGFSSLGEGILGGTSSNLFTYVPIEAYYGLLQQTGTSKLDSIATANLSPLSATGSVNVLVPGYLNSATQTGIAPPGSPRFAPDGQPISNTMALSTANVKALIGGFENVIDAEIQFSSDFAFDFNPTNGITKGSYDFVGVAVHEIGHALGFLSGADDFDYFTGYPGTVDDAWWAYGLDIFRYSADAKGLDLTPGADAYFSIDGGATAFMDGYFSTGTDYGDGWQASHWKTPAVDCTDLLGIMNPYICSATVDSVTALDIAAFDAIGWNTTIDVIDDSIYEMTTAQMYAQFAPAVPETTTWAMMLIGLGAVGMTARGRRRREAQDASRATLQPRA